MPPLTDGMVISRTNAVPSDAIPEWDGQVTGRQNQC